MAFRGWPSEALEFYEGLEADNSRTYWLAHKAVYDEQVRAPMLALLADLSAEFGPGKIFRPNRDVRFSADKSPYKTTVAATLHGGGYVQLSAHGLAAGNGMYGMSPQQVARYRVAVAEDVLGGQLVRVVDGITRKGITVTGRDQLKTTPKGYPADHPRIDLLRNKGLIAWQEWPAAAWLGTAAAKKRVVDFLRTTAPLHAWLTDHVGPDAE